MQKYSLFSLLAVAAILQVTNGKNETASTVDYPDESTEIVLVEELKQKLPGRIVNGTKAQLGQFPQQVSLRRRFSQAHFCGGSILTNSWILTAAHCMLDNNQNYIDAFSIIVVAGETALKNTIRARQWSYVERRFIHPRFSVRTLHNDVALLKLEKSLVYDDYVNPIQMARRIVSPGTVCQVSGWGYDKFHGNVVSGSLMFVDIPLLPISVCRHLLQEISLVPEGMFCAGYIEGGKDACQGDSGGGLLCNGLLTGVVSGGEGCAWANYPGLYADVRIYLPWIESHLNNSKYNLDHRKGSASSTTSSLLALSLIVVIPRLAYFY